jgi:hypothetical protein
LYSRTRRPLTRATLTLLAIACAAAVGASSAAAASQHAKATIHKISACGYTATASGTYELTQNVTDSGSGPCITLNGNKITLYLDAHTITGTGTDECILVEGGGTAESVNETVIGGTVKKPKKTATLTHCETGLLILRTSGGKASNLKIVAPTNAGVVEDLSGGTLLTNMCVYLGASSTASGVILAAGSDNVVTKSMVDSNTSNEGFLASAETGSAFTYDTVKNTYNTGGSTGIGFLDAAGSQNTFSHDSSTGQFTGFLFAESGTGPVTATYDSATGPSANPASYGFEVIGAYRGTNSASPFHTLISHDKSNGFQYGFFDTTSAGGVPLAETWTNNTADNYSEYGFYIDYPTDFTMSGNVADANTSGKTYKGGSTCGFCLAHVAPGSTFASFAKNQAYDNEYGFNASGLFVGGKGNVAKRNKYNAVNVEITG